MLTHFIKKLYGLFKSPIKNLKNIIKTRNQSFMVKDKTKYFCIGRNKTGTTSLKKSFEDLGFFVGDQTAAELLTHKYYFESKFDEIIEYCKTAQVFQDVPFSYPETFKHLDKAYPGSKFILTVRNDANQWYRSLTRFHSKLLSSELPPTVEDLLNATYIKKGFMYDVVRLHLTSDSDPYNKNIMTKHYNLFNQSVKEYFKDRPNDLLVINLEDKGSYSKFTKFIKTQSPFSDFPWENKT